MSILLKHVEDGDKRALELVVKGPGYEDFRAWLEVSRSRLWKRAEQKRDERDRHVDAAAALAELLDEFDEALARLGRPPR